VTDEAAVGSIGDRVERAIERHADTVGEIRRGEREKPRALRRNVVWLVITSISLYLVFPALVETFSSWRQITRFSPAWMLVMFLLQVGVCACMWDLQRVALGGVHWRPVISAQLASNALSNIAPGGGPLGAALQYRIFVAAGLARSTVASALTAVNLLVFAVVLGLPVLAIPGLLLSLSVIILLGFGTVNAAIAVPGVSTTRTPVTPPDGGPVGGLPTVFPDRRFPVPAASRRIPSNT